MLQSRSKTACLKARREKREFAVYGLLASKGDWKIQPLPPTPRKPRQLV
jgi:hypothetical protein